jgi:hypothetical protein
MKKSELIQNARQEMLLEQMQDNIITMAKDISDLNLDVLTVREGLNELKQLVKNWRKTKNGKED